LPPAGRASRPWSSDSRLRDHLRLGTYDRINGTAVPAIGVVSVCIGIAFLTRHDLTIGISVIAGGIATAVAKIALVGSGSSSWAATYTPSQE